MPVTYTNRKGVTYTLCRKTTKNGRQHYFFTPEPKGETVEELPEGYEIRENVNGQVSIRKIRPQVISEQELSVVQRALERHPEARKYRADIKGTSIQVFESYSDLDRVLDVFQDFLPMSPQRLEAVRQEGERSQNFDFFLRFKLIDKERRVFQAIRKKYSGREGWITIGRPGPLEELVDDIIPLLGTDEYFTYI